MKSGNTKNESAQSTEVFVRTTLVLPDTLDRNLEVMCAVMGLNKSQAVRDALTEFLIKHGFQPDKKPRTVIGY